MTLANDVCFENAFVSKAATNPVKLNKTKVTLRKGKKVTLRMLGTKKKVRWSTSHKSIATVKKGVVTAKKKGKATITATCAKKKYTCKITVKAEKKPVVKEEEEYTTKEQVALYLYTYHKLPRNYITKQEAKSLGWTGGSLEAYAPGKSIGGDYFGNYEGLLPKVEGRTYYECDIDTKGAAGRGAKRIVFSKDGWIYYTEDHYQTFTTLYKGSK